MSAIPESRLLKKLRSADRPVDAQSIALFRLGEMCNNKCPMCSNSGRPEAFFIQEDALLERVAFLKRRGFSRVVLTGGEPTIHPSFWTVVDALGKAGIAWDINTHGRSFADRAFAARAQESGLGRAIVSLHSHRVEPSMVIFGVSERGHHETVEGIENLLAQGVWLMLNCVFSRENIDHIEEYVRFCVDRFGTGYVLKLVFPSTTGKGGDWEAIHLTYAEAGPVARRAAEVAREAGLRMAFESFPNCVLDQPRARNTGRSGFGETHYLDDISGDRIYPIDHIETELSVYGPQCAGCRAVRRCAGVASTYAARVGTDELVPYLTESGRSR
ncbi:MAG: radical SAM protein [Myxococcota bacterium]